MNSWQKISLFFLSLLIWNTGALAETASTNQPAEIRPVEESGSSTYPANTAKLFAIHPHMESGLNLRDRLPVPPSPSDKQDNTFGSLFIEAALQHYASAYFRLSRLIDRGLTVKKLIFPFHSFL